MPDSLDKCPNAAEDLDGYQDSDGCPDSDNDADGVPDSIDKCISVAGPADNNGCPKPKTDELKRGPLILNGVMFEAGDAVLSENSYATLDQVAKSLLEWSNVKLEIQGHTDNRGNEAGNEAVSLKRAEAVREYLIKKGVAADRLKAIGFGSNQPIASNDTKSGRQRNRRVEFHRTD